MKNYRKSRKPRGLRAQWDALRLSQKIACGVAIAWVSIMAVEMPSVVRDSLSPATHETRVEIGTQRVLKAQADADAAKDAIRDRRYELESGYCSRYVRQVVSRRPGGAKYAYLFGASARISADNFLRSPWGYRWPRDKAKLGGIRAGDILFKRFGSGGYGHVGIYAGNMLVAENSSTSIGRIQGSKGYRSLAQFNADKGVDVIGRLPAPAATPTPKPAERPTAKPVLR